QVLAPPGLCQLVERGDTPIGARVERVSNEVAANEPRAAGDQDVKHELKLYHPEHKRRDSPVSVASPQRRVLPKAPKKFEKVPSPASTNDKLIRRSDGIGAEETRWKFWNSIWSPQHCAMYVASTFCETIVECVRSQLRPYVRVKWPFGVRSEELREGKGG